VSSAWIWRAEDLGGLKLFQATISEVSVRPHAHEEFFVAVTEAGLATPVYRGNRHPIGPGDLIVLNPEKAHAGGPPAEGSRTYRALHPPQDIMREVMAECPPGRPVRFGGDVIRDRDIRARLRRAYLEEHAQENTTLPDVARCAGLSAFHLCRVFGATVGMPPHAYQTQVRVRRAKSPLRAGVPIATAATAAGLYDQAHLTRHFKRILGLTPSRYVNSEGGT
jgi:AraC-like DNA-binding protein